MQGTEAHSETAYRQQRVIKINFFLKKLLVLVLSFTHYDKLGCSGKRLWVRHGVNIKERQFIFLMVIMYYGNEGKIFK